MYSSLLCGIYLKKNLCLKEYKSMGRDRALTFAKALHVHPAVLLFPDFDMSQVA